MQEIAVVTADEGCLILRTRQQLRREGLFGGRRAELADENGGRARIRVGAEKIDVDHPNETAVRRIEATEGSCFDWRCGVEPLIGEWCVTGRRRDESDLTRGADVAALRRDRDSRLVALSDDR